jgi:uncharacterized protein YegL
MAIDFLRPLFLVLLLAVPLLWFFPRRIDRVARGVMRSLLFAMLILALAGPVLVTSAGSLFQILVLDQSASLSAAQRERAGQLLAQWRARLTDPEHSAVVVIGSAGAGAPALPADLRNPIVINPSVSESPLSAALVTAELQIPAGAAGVITLVSDGLATDRRWGPVVQRLIARGVPVAAYDLGRRENDVYPVRLSSDPLWRVGQTARVVVDVIGQATAVRVKLSDADGRELAASAPIDSSGRVSVPLEFEPRAAGFLSVKAEVIAAAGADADPSNNTLQQAFAVQAALRLLYLGERIQGAVPRLGQLLGRGFEVQDGSGLVLDGNTDLSGFDLVVVDDRPASRLPEAFQAKLATAIQKQGLGLIFSGGKASFGTGGYDQSALAETLPIDFVQRTEKRDPSTALAIIIDTSGSMGGNRIELAKQVARLAVRRLKAHDRVGIVEFYGNKSWALPLQSAANKITIDRALGRMQASGGTVMYPALEEAYYGLKNLNTRYKHVLVITDAGVEDADYEGLMRLFTRDRVNVSTVLIGAGAHNQNLIDLATWGKGRFYSAQDRYSLPEVVLKQSTTMNLPAYKTGDFPVATRGAAGWWGEIDRQTVPALSGYVETQARGGAEVLLEVEGNGHPVLASWLHGLGRVTAFATEPLGDGTSEWKAWRNYGRWLARVASRTAGDTRPFRFEIERPDQVVAVTARRYADRGALWPRAALLDEQGREGRPLEFRQLSPGHFRAETVVDPRKEVRASAVAVGGSAGTPVGPAALLVSAAAADVSREQQVDPETALNLPGLAKVTGGVFVDATRSAALAPGPVPRTASASLALLELWPYATLAALLLYLSELLYRRWPRTLGNSASRP